MSATTVAAVPHTATPRATDVLLSDLATTTTPQGRDAPAVAAESLAVTTVEESATDGGDDHPDAALVSPGRPD